MLTNFFRKDDFAVFLIGHIPVIFQYFSQNESAMLKMDLILRRETTETRQCCTIAWIFRGNFSVDSPHPPKSVQNTMATRVYGYVTLPL